MSIFSSVVEYKRLNIPKSQKKKKKENHNKDRGNSSSSDLVRDIYKLGKEKKEKRIFLFPQISLLHFSFFTC